MDDLSHGVLVQSRRVLKSTFPSSMGSLLGLALIIESMDVNTALGLDFNADEGVIEDGFFTLLVDSFCLLLP